MAPHSSTLAWKIPWTEEPGGLQSMGLLTVGHNWATSLSLPCIGEGNGNPLQCSCLENPRDGGAWWAAISGVAQSRTRLKWLSSSSSSRPVLLAAILELLSITLLGCMPHFSLSLVQERGLHLLEHILKNFLRKWLWETNVLSIGKSENVSFLNFRL